MKRIYILSILSILLLTACGKTQESAQITEKTVPQEKIPFQIQTQKIADINNTVHQEKTAIVQASSSLTLTSQISGDILNIPVKEGSTLKKGSLVASISDTIYGYHLAVRSAEANVRVQELQKKTNALNLDQSIQSAETGYKQAQESLKSLQNNTGIQYDTLVQKNKDTLTSYDESYQSHLQSIEQQMTQYLHEGDKILGMTENYERKNDTWEDYLGIYNGAGRKLAMDAWNTLYAERGKIRSIIEKGQNFQDGNMNTKIAEIESGYKELSDYAQEMVSMIQNNQIGYGLSTEQQQTWVQSWNTIQNTIQGSQTGFKSWKANIVTFLTNYKKQEEATRLATIRLSRPLTPSELKQITEDSELNLFYKQTLVSLQNNDENAKITLDQAKKSLGNSQKIKQATLSGLQANIDSAKIALQQAQYNANKLRITAPMTGIITKILVEKGQSVNAGTPIAEFVSNTPEIEIDIAPNLARILQIGQSIDVMIEGKKHTGTITARSQVAGANLLSTLRISLPKNIHIIGKTATVIFEENMLEQSVKSFLLPLSAVKIVAEGEGEISLLNNRAIETKKVAIGQLFGKNVEIISDLPQESIVILSDVSNFDPETATLVIQ